MSESDAASAGEEKRRLMMHGERKPQTARGEKSW